ncbi:hypothetical protein J6590_089415 [Homalodisca vitripennis]|nr:hypothetical protein J6590_086145 [Homalodisca vitripennis]KAG8329318.1 hypothetical protein J6590_089415 [Homalodisca vitripennis]
MFVIKQNKKSGFCDFRLNLIRQILETHHTPREGRLVAAAPRVVPPPAATRDQHPLRLTGRHFPPTANARRSDTEDTKEMLRLFSFLKQRKEEEGYDV